MAMRRPTPSGLAAITPAPMSPTEVLEFLYRARLADRDKAVARFGIGHRFTSDSGRAAAARRELLRECRGKR